MGKKILIISSLMITIVGVSFFTCLNISRTLDEKSINNIVKNEIYNENNFIKEDIDNKIVDSGLLNKEEKEIVKKEEVSNNNVKTNESTNKEVKEENKNTNPDLDDLNDLTLNKPEEIIEEELLEEKFGTKIYNYVTYKIEYNDGTTKKTKKSSRKVIDVSGYNATITDLKEEAEKIVNDNKSIYNELLEIVNSYRKEVNVNPLILDYNLSVVATMRSLEMAYTNNMSHTRPNGEDCFSLLKELNVPFSWAGENIAAGQNSASSVALSWKNSLKHYENMISTNFNKIGLGMVKLSGTKYGIYWTQSFTD